ncbi:PilC/PilY family type IV pilus protein [Thermosulfuriphilus sp.]
MGAYLKPFVFIFVFYFAFVRPVFSQNICGELPIYMGTYSIPEILFVVDLSGSMILGPRPDYTPSYDSGVTYSGFYTDQGLANKVFNRQYIIESNLRYHLLYQCFDDPSHIVVNTYDSSNPENSQCPVDLCSGAFRDSSGNVTSVLNQYGIADWSWHRNNLDPPTITLNGDEIYFMYHFCDQSCAIFFPGFFQFCDEFGRPAGYESDTLVLGNYLNMSRIEVATRVIRELVTDSSLSTGVAFFKADFPDSQYFTRIYVGCEPYSESHLTTIYNALDAIAHQKVSDSANVFRVMVGGGTPFSPSIVAAKEYFAGNIADELGNTYSPQPCGKKFAIFLTDGQGNIDSTEINVETRTRELVQSGVTAIAVGFNLPPDQDAQLRVMARVANEEADGVNTFALHRDNDNDGVPDPFIARNPDELADILRSIIYEIKQTVFRTGSGTATKTNYGNIQIYTGFDVSDWTGEVRTGPYRYNCANCHSLSNARALARWYHFEDVDGDGHLDAYDEDINGNNQLDPEEDIDGDGNLDVAEQIDANDLRNFLLDQDAIAAAMGSEALVGYDSSKVDDIVNLILGNLDASLWYASDTGWTTNTTLPCGASRNIYTKDANGKFEFTVANLDRLNALISPDTYDLSQEDVNFIRGELACGSTVSGYRTREHPLGDIINSQPKVEDNRIWVGANDGMLHAFDLNTGEEVFAYIPSAVLPRYKELNYFSGTYCHDYFLDGTPIIEDLGSQKILVCGLGRGGNQFFALDVTTPTATGITPLWEFSDPNLGETWNEARIAHLEDDSWVAFLPSGYAENDADWINKVAWLYAVGATNGAYKWGVQLGVEGENMLTTPVAVDSDFNDRADRLYVGDMKGRIWKLESLTTSPTSQIIINLGSNHPITARPAYAIANDKVWIYFGTGKFWDWTDGQDGTVQYMVGLRDEGMELTLTDLNVNQITIVGNYAIISGSCDTTKPGWAIELPRTGPAGGAERILTPPLVLGGYVFFVTFIPTGDQCSGTGEAWLFVVRYDSGCMTLYDGPVFDVNNDGAIDENDKILVNGTPAYPAGLKIGEGVPVGELNTLGDLIIQATTEGNQPILTSIKAWFKKGSWRDLD